MGVVAGDRPARILRNRETPLQTSSLELFFDLAIIVAFALLTRRLVGDISWLNVVQTLVLVAGVWWIWVATAWSTDWFDPDQPFIQRLVLAVMFGGLLMATATPTAFGGDGLTFAAAYVGIHLGRAVVLLTALRGHVAGRRTLRVAVWFSVSAIPWLVGGFMTGTPRLVLWIVALTVDYGIAWFGWPVPGLGRAATASLRVVGEHLSERYRQVFIVALGEVVLVSGITYAVSDLHPIRMLAFAITFANAALLLWIYIARPGDRLGSVIDENPPRVAVFAAYCHAVIIAGAVFTAVGDELVINDPLHQSTAFTGIILGGTVLFLVGRIMVDFLVHGRRSWPRLIGLAVIVASTPGLLIVSPLAGAATTNFILLGVVVAHAYSMRSSSDRTSSLSVAPEPAPQEPAPDPASPAAQAR